MANFNSNLLLNNENLGRILDAINALPDEEDSKEEGYTEGFEAGKAEGEAVGYSKGYNKGVEDTTPSGEIEITENGAHNVAPYASAKVNVGGGGSSISSKGVNFYDYDGTLLHSYTVEEAQALTELPQLPTQKGLICQGWNYDLETIKSYNRAVDVGATYITDDGKTRLYITIAAEGRMTVPLYFNQTVANGVTIDWGDGSTTETLSGTGNKNTSHTYANIGNYIISLDVTSGTLSLGRRSSSYCVMGLTNNNGKVYNNMLKKVEIGNLESIASYAFNKCAALKNITIPNSVIVVGRNAFYACDSLACVVVPNGITSFDYETFYNCYSIRKIVMPNSIISIADYAFYGCHSLESMVMPIAVTTIKGYVFYNCYTLKNITMPKSVTSIGAAAFYNCFCLTDVNITDSLIEIGSNAFNSCNNLMSITIPNGMSVIPAQTFSYCYSVTNVVIPKSVTSIEAAAFSYCTGMAIYDFTACTSVPTLSATSAFSNIPSDCIIKVPSDLVDEWKTATNWATYANKIVEV